MIKLCKTTKWKLTEFQCLIFQLAALHKINNFKLSIKIYLKEWKIKWKDKNYKNDFYFNALNDFKLSIKRYFKKWRLNGKIKCAKLIKKVTKIKAFITINIAKIYLLCFYLKDRVLKSLLLLCTLSINSFIKYKIDKKVTNVYTYWDTYFNLAKHRILLMS